MEAEPLVAVDQTGTRAARTNGRRGRRLRSDTLNDNLRSKALEPLSVRYPQAKFQSIAMHCLCHFFGTYATYCGISATEIDARMGNGASSMSQHYFHTEIELACKSIKKFWPLLTGDSEDEIDNGSSR